MVVNRVFKVKYQMRVGDRLSGVFVLYFYICPRVHTVRIEIETSNDLTSRLLTRFFGVWILCPVSD